MIEAAIILGLLPLTASGLLPLASPSGGSLGGLSPEDPIWRRIISQSNASAVFSIPGRDITKPWPGTAVDGWTLNMTAMDIVPYAVGWDLRVIAPESLYTDSPKPPSDNYTALDLYNVTNGKEIKAHPDWVVCAWFTMSADDTWENMTRSDNPKDLSTKPDGDCSQWLPDACVKALEKAAETSYSTNDKLKKYTYQPRVACQPIGWPEECEGATTADFSTVLSYPELPARYLTGATTFTNGYEFLQRDEDHGDYFDPRVNQTFPPQSDAPGMWAEVTREWLGVITLFGHYNGSSDAYDGEPGFAKMSCIRPEKIKGTDIKDKDGDGKSGSKDGDGKEGDDKDSSASRTITTSMGLYGALLVVGFWMW